MFEKFTPGPWSMDSTGSVVNASGGYVAEAFDGLPGSDTDQEIASANARLVAAAPELFEALRELVAIRTIKDKLEEPNNGEWPDMAALRERTDAAWASARAALLKASPEQSNV